MTCSPFFEPMQTADLFSFVLTGNSSDPTQRKDRDLFTQINRNANESVIFQYEPVILQLQDGK